ncbi:MAG: hypothetical protein NTY02_20390 [Acidobacteria bacterium]|nr:hypothetical protein [Acidobacteriota bacterium]
MKLCLGLPDHPCSNLTRRSRCRSCEHELDHRRGSAASRGYDRQYRNERELVIGGPCALRLPGCTGIATTGQHVVPVSRGGKGGPLVGACAHCNYALGNREAPG